MNYDYLKHHGILGQKWGVRRFQNRDGSYTSEGKKRHAAESESTGSKIKSGLRKAQHIADRATIIKSKTRVGTTDTYDNATKGPMGTNKSRRQADWEADHGINDQYYQRYNEGKKVREAEKREKEYKELTNKVKKSAGSELSKRGKAAFDVLKNGDKDWMGNTISNNDPTKELTNRGKAALERLLYSQEQIDNKKFFGRYNF